MPLVVNFGDPTLLAANAKPPRWPVRAQFDGRRRLFVVQGVEVAGTVNDADDFDAARDVPTQDEVGAYWPGAEATPDFRPCPTDTRHIGHGLVACRNLAQLRGRGGRIVLGEVFPQVEQISVGLYRIEHLRHPA